MHGREGFREVLAALGSVARATAAETDPKVRAAVVTAKVQQLMSEIGCDTETEELPRNASRVLTLFEEVGLPREQSRMGHIIMGIGKTYERLGNNADAYNTYNRALVHAERGGDKALEAGCLRRMGRVKMRMSQWKLAEEHLARSQELYSGMSDTKGEAETLCDLGSLHYSKGRLDDAAEQYNRSLELAETLEHHVLEINVKNNLGVIANVRGEVETAISHYMGCVPLAEKLENKVLLAQAYHNLGMAYADRKNWNAAGDAYDKALRLAKEESVASILGTVYLNKAQMFMELNDTEMAAISCGKALTIFKKAEDPLGEAEVYRTLASIYVQRKDEITATELYLQSLHLTEEAGVLLEMAETCRAMAEGMEELGHVGQAIEAWEKAVRYFADAGAEGDKASAEKELERLQVKVKE